MTLHSEPSDRAVLTKCASCDGPMTSPAFCDNCRSLYPVDRLNHFELLGLEPAYDLDRDTLRQHYLHVSRGVHPDHHGDASSTLSLRLSAQLNEAHRVLADPVLRAEYLLELHGGPSAAENRNVPPEVLSETLLLREQMQEAQTDNDQAALTAVADEARAAHDKTLGEVADLARQLPGNEALRTELRAKLNAIKYYQRLLAET